MMDETEFPVDARRRWKLIAPIIAALLAFAAGCFATGYAVRHWDRLAQIVQPKLSVPATIVTVPAAIPPQAPVVGKLVERVDSLDERIKSIDSQAREANGNADRAEALLVAFAARRVIDRGQPLGYLETMLRNHFGGVEPQAVAMTIAAAQRPITLSMLQQSFADLAPSLVAAPPRQSWWKGFRRELGTLIVIRRSDTPSMLPDDRRDRARRALEQGQVELALTEVARLPGAAAATDWIATARRYVLAHNALDRIETAALLAPAQIPAAAPQPEPAQP